MTELKASLETIQTTAKELITEIEGHFTELQQQRQAEQEQGDTFSIYQLKRGDETRDLRFEPYDRLQAAGLTIDRVNYELVYTAPLTKDMTLGDIWERFNIDHPADFKGHSLSVSDIVVLHQNDEDTAHYVDSIGFQQVPEFLQEQQTPYLTSCRPNSSKPCPTPYKTLCKCWLTQTSGFMATLRARPLKQSRRKDIPTRTGSLKSSSRKRPPTAF